MGSDADEGDAGTGGSMEDLKGSMTNVASAMLASMPQEKTNGADQRGENPSVAQETPNGDDQRGEHPSLEEIHAAHVSEATTPNSVVTVAPSSSPPTPSSLPPTPSTTSMPFTPQPVAPRTPTTGIAVQLRHQGAPGAVKVHIPNVKEEASGELLKETPGGPIDPLSESPDDKKEQSEKTKAIASVPPASYHISQTAIACWVPIR